ncbi:MAG: hypothetical protein ACR2OB_01055 [Solirubrobacteraceae bacterium]
MREEIRFVISRAQQLIRNGAGRDQVSDATSRPTAHINSMSERALARNRWCARPIRVQPDGPVAELAAGDQIERVGPGDVVAQWVPLARDVGVQVQAELVDQVESHQRPPES